jgi:hypothetical protein
MSVSRWEEMDVSSGRKARTALIGPGAKDKISASVKLKTLAQREEGQVTWIRAPSIHNIMTAWTTTRKKLKACNQPKVFWASW